MTNDLEKRNATALAEFAGQLHEDAGQGAEDFGADDIALPFINLLQALSPQVQRGPYQVEGAQPGDFYNTVTGQVYSGEDGVLVIPVAYEKVYVEWVPRDAGGGFVAQYKSQEEALEQADPENEVSDTALRYIMIQNPSTGAFEQAIMSMTSTKLKTSRRWNTKIMMKRLEIDGEKFTPPSYAYTYLMSSISQTNNEGTFFNVRIEDTGELIMTLESGRELYEACKAFRALVTSGTIGANFNPSTDDDEEEGDEAF